MSSEFVVRVISMPDRLDRRDHFISENEQFLRALSGGWEWLDPPRFGDEADGFRTPAIRSCLQSHLEAAEETAGDGRHLVIFEDDAEPAVAPELLPDIWEAVRRFCARAGSLDHSTILQLGWVPDPAASCDLRHGGAKRFYEDVEFGLPLVGSHAYVVPADSIKQWAAHLRSIADGELGERFGHITTPMGPDGALNTWPLSPHSGRRFVLRTMIYRQASFRSDITPSRTSMVADRLRVPNRFEDRLRRELRRVRQRVTAGSGR